MCDGGWEEESSSESSCVNRPSEFRDPSHELSVGDVARWSGRSDIVLDEHTKE